MTSPAAMVHAMKAGVTLQLSVPPDVEISPDDASRQACRHQYKDGLHHTWWAEISQTRMQIHQLPITIGPAKWMLVGLHKSCCDHDNIPMLSITICPAEGMLVLSLAIPQEQPDASQGPPRLCTLFMAFVHAQPCWTGRSARDA